METIKRFQKNTSSKDLLPRKPVKKKAPVIDHRKAPTTTSDAPSALVLNRPKTRRDLELITAALNNHFIFTSLTEENREVLIKETLHYTLGPHEFVFKQNSPGQNFFVVASGKLEVLVNNKRVNVLKPGDSFGELALLHDTFRSASVKTIERVTMWGLDRRTFRKAVETLNTQNYEQNKRFIESVPLFAILTADQKEMLISSLATQKFRHDEKIVNEGDPGDLFYIIKEGAVSCQKEGTEIRQMFQGDFFGEQALLYNSPRTASIVSVGNVKLLSIGRRELTQALGSQLQQIIYLNSIRIAIEKSGVLKKLHKGQVDSILKKVEVKSFQEGELVVPASTPKAAHLYIVLKGQVRSNGFSASKFDCIGDTEMTLKSREVFNEGIFADGEIDIATISYEDFEESIGGDFECAVSNNEAIEVLKDVQLMKGLSLSKIQEVVKVLQVEDFQNGEVIVQQNEEGDSFYIVKSGIVDVFKDGSNLRSITMNDYFGERSILFNDRRSASVVANGQVRCWVLHKEDFLRIIDESMRIQLMKRIELQDDSITLADLAPLKLLGKGMFGNVFLAVHRGKGHLYAVKSINRRKIEKFGIQENLVLERKILLQIDHVLIIKLIKTFKDQDRVYFLMEFVKGMDLFDVIRSIGLVSESDSKFYTACLILIIEHLHDRNIIYRDLKPENVMVDEEGYPKLIDFGTAKIVQGRTYTIVGTPHYMAPEVILGHGYGISADYWSIGVMLYEFLCGGVPFGEEEEDPYEIYEKVLEYKLVYPNYLHQSLPAKPLIEQLLSRNSALRTGGSIQNLKSHEWFRDLNWDSVLCRQVPAPFQPPVKDFSDKINKALKKQTTIQDVILHEESQERLPAANKHSKNLLADWDQDF
mmetsp:Transcript_3449/g.5312  ORF Transcript_3449/g.5312 Transcript_3449/m.5312 type:complete len:871 (-) Transcript_3449:744-3356(-)